MRKIVSVIVFVLFITNIFISAFVVGAAEAVVAQELSFNNENNSSENDDATIASMLNDLEENFEGISLHQTLSKTNYNANELISVQYELKGCIEDVDTMYVSEGFSIVGDITNSVDMV